MSSQSSSTLTNLVTEGVLGLRLQEEQEEELDELRRLVEESGRKSHQEVVEEEDMPDPLLLHTGMFDGLLPDLLQHQPSFIHHHHPRVNTSFYNAVSQDKKTSTSPTKQCANCGAKNTPTWRRCPEGKLLLCNACGLYLKNHKTHRRVIKAPDGQLRVARTNSMENGSTDKLKLSRSQSEPASKKPKTSLDTAGALVWVACARCGQLQVVPMRITRAGLPVVCQECILVQDK